MGRARRRVYYSGRVQGVGFRYTCCSLARGMDVDGHVRNLPDGRVELVAEGSPEELDRFQDAIGEAMGHYIDEAIVEELAPNGPGEGPAGGFVVRH